MQFFPLHKEVGLTHIRPQNNVSYDSSLKYLLELGVQVRQKHRVIAQSGAMVKAILSSTTIKEKTPIMSLRRHLQTHNSVFGKRMENVNNFMEMELTTKERMTVHVLSE